MHGNEPVDGQTADTLRGLPQTVHSAYTPLGEIEQAGKIADGLRAERQGWRKVVFRIGIGLIAAAVITVVVVVIYAQSRA
jgi:hypothetical protein